MSPATVNVTIGLPVFNGACHLPATLECLLAQTYADFELIISDNASTDATEDICRHFAAQDPRIRYIRQPANLGAVPNFNFVFEQSNSTYFKWAAVDDYCDPSYLAKAVAVLDSDPSVIWCHSRSSHIDADGRPLDDQAALNVSYHERTAVNAADRFKAVLLGTKGSLDSYGLIRSSAIGQTPLFLPFYGPEKVFMAELALLGRYHEIPETLFYARVLAAGSGNMQSAADQQNFVDTQSKSRRPWTRVRFLFGYLSAIRRSAPTFADWFWCHVALLQWLGQASKWRAVFLKAIRGQGVGAGNTDRVKQINQRYSSAPHHAGDPERRVGQ